MADLVGGTIPEVVVSLERPMQVIEGLIMLRFPLSVLSIAWSGVLAFDVIVFVLTLYKAIKVGYNVPLIQVLVRDGKRSWPDPYTNNFHD